MRKGVTTMTAPKAATNVDTSAPSTPAGDSATDTTPNTTQVGPEIPTDDTNSVEPQAEGEPEAAVEQPEGDDVAREQFLQDQKTRAENPDEPVVRAANPAIGGEAFL